MYLHPVTEFKKEDDKWRVLVHLSKEEVLDGGLISSLPPRFSKEAGDKDGKEELSTSS